MVVTIPLQDAAKDSSLRRTLTELSLGVIKSKRIVVVTGAGISCSCGIPVCANTQAVLFIYMCGSLN